MADIAIFGTPPEPVFNLKGRCLSSELLEELLYVQAAQNENAVKNACSTDGAFKQGSIAEMVFLVCDKFNQPPEARYLAVEIFDRFMTKYVHDQFKKLHSDKGGGKKTNTTWNSFLKKLQKHLKLYIMSCVQIASKMCSHYKILTNRKCSRFLLNAGLGCTSATILRTELTILETLDYRVYNTSPLTYIETLLEIMGHNDNTTSVKILHETSLKVMDLAYLKRGSVYDQLFRVASGRKTSTPEEREKFALVEHDMMLFAMAVIGAASYVTDRTTSDQVINHVGRITCIPTNDILEFATVLVQNLHSDDHP
ncbi:cyclin N-terminal domain-containing protein 1-like [Patiria miniata]|uniref:Cyclin N-terminal domain-containing protein n=1 Tax=Patiria miniata TaxID=46514 RepID=A0A913Z5X9_PATMI|nr:cyclin N-terminal domain-containing protein 1-like [Patiria miniata]